ncbi:enhancer of split m4 protein-like [Musca vetustissima]|uniref:enhancer of split m4 protein-like n=1 Tax=Musca vetustissima TaxID=27455 RepID=UPI002AB7F087|nr:enhancer of split m4 protein-like [Musca vetustissima]
MCLQINNSQQFEKLDATTASKKMLSYSIKKLLKQIFKNKSQKLTQLQKDEDYIKEGNFLDSNCNNTAEINLNFVQQNSSLEKQEEEIPEPKEVQIPEPLAFTQSYEVEEPTAHPWVINQSCEVEDFDFSDLSVDVPVHFVRTEHGTFFWTSNSEIPADNDLVQPMSCSTNNQLAYQQSRWTEV